MVIKYDDLIFAKTDGSFPLLPAEAYRQAMNAFSGTRVLTVRSARKLAVLVHGDQRYGNDSLEIGARCRTHRFVRHLDILSNIARRFNINDSNIRIALYLHDVIEDTLLTAEDLLNCGVSLPQLALIEAVTDAPGATRHERKSATYMKIAATPGADVVKVIDRIGNTESTLCSGADKFALYREEFPEFRSALFNPSNHLALPLWNYLDWLYTEEARFRYWASHRCCTPKSFLIKALNSIDSATTTEVLV